MARELTLVIPGLWGPAALRAQPALWQDLSLPALEQLLVRAVREDGHAQGREAMLFQLFNVAVPPGGDPPVAAVTRQWEAGDADGDGWLRADPVHLLADRDRIVMVGNSALTLSAEECAQLAAELNQHFAADGWDLRAANGARWYLRLDNPPRIRTSPLPETVGQNVLHHMPEGDDAARWRSILNETQMVLHGSAVNRQREARGLPAVNSLWFWGGGRLPAAPAPVFAQVWANDALTRALAALADTPCDSLPENAEEWLGHDTDGAELLVMDALREKALRADVESWRAALTTVHEEWLAPLLAALRRRRLGALSLYGTDGRLFRITAQGARRWWVRRRPLGVWLWRA